MACIYKITNKISGKSYIGQTRTSLSERMNKHYSRANTDATTGIDFAIKKYGKENFSVEVLKECKEEELDNLERYYIEFYDTYNNGYNLTLGGQDGLGSKIILNYDEVIAALEEYRTIAKASEKLGCCDKVLSRFMKDNNISYYYTGNNAANIIGKGRQFKEGDQAKKVHIVELNKTFNSLKECSQWLMDNKYSKAATMDATRKSLSRHLNGERQTYLGMHFTFVND